MISAITSASQAQQAISGALSRYFGTSVAEASQEQLYKAVATVVRDILLQKRNDFNAAGKKAQHKRVYYFSIEFLMGRSLKNNLFSLGLTEFFEQAARDMGFSLPTLYDQEPDAGLGNGGLGRLAACYMDALASQNLPAYGFSILYEYGLFKQKIVEGWQTELPDIWLPGGEVWLTPRTDLSCNVRFNGTLSESWEDGRLNILHTDYDEVEAVPYDMMVPGYDSEGVSLLRLWRAREKRKFDMALFSNGDYARATMENTNAEMISMVLYPSDNHFEGKTLRLKQQYFLVSASMQYITKNHFHRYKTMANFAEKTAIHINDTHPALCIPELMRILLDDYHMTWEDAFQIVGDTMAYTNHTVLSEALETWPEDMISRMLPRIYNIIKDMNERFCKTVWECFPGDWGKIEHMAILSHNQVRMANLSIVGSHAVNGVSRLHTEILRDDVFHDFYLLWPRKFKNITNGIAHRRWLCQANPRLCGLLDETIGPGYAKQPDRLKQLMKFSGDTAVLQRLGEIKHRNKQDFAKLIAAQTGVVVDPTAIFDVQIKRLHEYKRQLLNALHIVSLYLQLKENPNLDIPPRVFVFAAKAAPSYIMAKKIISLIVNLGAEIEKDPIIRQKLRVVFMENYCVTMAEALVPAADVSEQISLAGKEASGTGNMKLMANGAVTLGTMDGANVEIREAVGDDSIFIFGMSDNEVDDLWRQGYLASYYYQRNPRLKAAVDALQHGFNGTSFADMAHYLLVGDRGMADPYMCLADFDAYAAAQTQLGEVHRDNPSWQRMALVNIAQAGRFAADRAIGEYARDIWGLERLDS